VITGPIKIGFLTPYSGVYPFYGNHLMAGILLGLYPDGMQRNEFQFIPVYTKQGDPKSVLEAVNQLVFFERVDIVSGLISYKSIPDIIPIIERHNALAFFFDMGECVPYFEHFSPRIFYSSQQIVQSQYALGHWAQKEYGDGGMMIMPVYEAGYHLNTAFYKGACAAGADTMALHVLPKDPSNIKNINLSAFFSEIAKNPPSYIHAIFAGDMGNDFLKLWRQSPFRKHIPLVVVENMAYEDVLEDIADLAIEMVSAATWSRNSEGARNREFVSKFENTGGQMANIYGLLGYEAGLALKEVKHLIIKRDLDGAAKLLQRESVTGPRGERNFYPLSGFSLPVIDIIKVSTSSKKIYKTVLSQGNGIRFDSPDFKEIHDESVSGWQNPYLCI